MVPPNATFVHKERIAVQLYLIRHGQSYVNLADWPNGNQDEGLTELGQAQAQPAGRLAAGACAHARRDLRQHHAPGAGDGGGGRRGL